MNYLLNKYGPAGLYVAKIIMYLSMALGICLVAFNAIKLMKGLEIAISNANSTIVLSRSTLERIDSVAKTYENTLQSPRSLKAIEASLEMAAAWKATAKLVNITTIPELNKTIQELRKSAEGLTQVTHSASNTLEGASINGNELTQQVSRTLSEGQATLQSFGRTIEKTGAGLEKVLGEGEKATAQLTGAFQELKLAMEETKQVMGFLRETASHAPKTAEALEKIAQSSSRWQTALRVIQIVATLGVLIK